MDLQPFKANHDVSPWLCPRAAVMDVQSSRQLVLLFKCVGAGDLMADLPGREWTRIGYQADCIIACRM
jgi:hypothetical protein